MVDQNELDRLYREAQAALKAKEYDRAAGLLTQILVIDEDYKDVSRLLAQSVRLKRRRWYNDPRMWATFGVLLLVGLGVVIAPKLSSFYAAQSPAQVVNATTTPSPTVIVTPTQTLLPTPTPIPLTWKRIAMGQEFERDTVTAFATDKKDPDVIYAGMRNAGVYKTIDGGLSWRPAHQGMSNTQVESLLIDSQNPQILYAGTVGGVFKTEDGGENWFRIGDGTYLLMDAQDNSRVYARDENAIYETTDQGKNWTTAYALKKNCPDEIHSWAIHPADGNMLFIGGGEICAGVYQSSDSGYTWSLIGLEDKPNIDTLVVGSDEQNGFSIYANYETRILYEEMQGIFVSHDGGASWSRTFNHACDILTSDPDNPATIYCAGSRLFVMRKKGDTWRQIPGTQSIGYSAVHVDHPGGTERIITSGTNGANPNRPYVGIFISTDGGASWTERIGGIGSAWAELKIDPIDNAKIFLGTYYVDLYGYARTACILRRSLDGGKNWVSIKGNATWCGPTFGVDNAIYLNELGKLQQSGNGGDTWLWDWYDPKWYSYNRNTDTENDRTLVFALPSFYEAGSQSISANPYASGLIYDVGDVIYYTTDAGDSWQLSAGSEGSWDARLFYTDQSKMIYAIGRYQQKYSTDNGKTWQNCGEDVTTSRSDTRLALDLLGSRLYLATPGQGVMISTDSCGSWQASNEGLSNLFVNTLAVDPNDSNTIYAGTDGGAYISYDSGATWGQVNDGLLGAVVVYSIAVDKESNAYAATPYGVFKLDIK